MSSLTGLETHQKIVHQKLLIFHCDECGKHFATNDVLRQHARSHELKHSCKECQASFTTLRKLKIHQSNMKHNVLRASHSLDVRANDLQCDQIKDVPLNKKKHFPNIDKTGNGAASTDTSNRSTSTRTDFKDEADSCVDSDNITALEEDVSVCSISPDEEHESFTSHQNADTACNETEKEQDADNAGAIETDIAVCIDEQDERHENMITHKNIHTKSTRNENEWEVPSDGNISSDQRIYHAAQTPRSLQSSENASKASMYTSFYAKKFIVEENERYKCLKCQKSLGFMQSAIDHVKRHLQSDSLSSNTMTWTSISREKFDSTVKETPVASHLSSNVKENIIKKGGKYVCKICSKKFQLKSKCYSHVRTHFVIKKFVCPDCGYASHSRSVLAVHMRIHKKKIIEFACGICQSAFATSPLLASHIKSHSDEDKIKYLNYQKCDECGELFKYRKHLYRHKLQHLDTFVCKSCDKIFSSPLDFENHTYEMSHFFCEECGKTMSSLTGLEMHQKKVHQKLLTFHCDECGKQFATNNVLRQHARTHELKHSCKECKASFTTLRELKSHQSNMKHKVLGAPHIVKVSEKDLLCEQIKNSRLRKKKCIKVKIGNCTTTAMQNAISVGSNGQHEKQGNFIRHPNADSKSNENKKDQDVGNTSAMAADIAVDHDQDDAHENLNIHTESNTNEKELEHLEGPSDTSNSTSFDQCIDDDAKLPQLLQGGEDTTNPSKANVYSSAYAKRFIVEENGKYKCLKCEKSLGFMDSAIDHVKRHLQGACFKCTRCPYATYTRHRLRLHFKCHNPSKKDMDILNSQMDSIDTSKSRNVQGTSSIKENITKQDNKYVCKICSKKFELKSKCYSHVQSHFIKNKFVCPDCGYSAYSRSVLAVHMRRIHKKKMIEFACGICQSAFETNPLLASHIKSHSDEDKIKYLNYRKCDECGEVFKYRKHLYRHKLQHLDTFRCKCCDEVFSSAVAFEDHTYENSHFFCEKCRKNYSSLTRLEDHQRMVHEKVLTFPCEVCGKQFVTNDVLNQHAQTHQLKHSCKECQASFTSFNALKSHQWDKHEVIRAPHSFEVREDELQCELCGKHFKTAGLLETHRLIHQALEEIGDDKRDGQHLGNIKPSQTLKCPKCPKTFKTVRHFRDHVTYHFLEKKYKCDICGLAFARKSYFRTHQNMHNNYRPFQCELCPRAFFDKGSRTQHIKARHQKQVKKIITCDICGKKVTKQSLWQHKIRHDKDRFKTFPCEQCDKKFYSAYQVKVHLKTHSNEPIAICDICGKSLKSKNSLREHLKGHTGEKPFKCGICDKTFKLKQWLQRHLRVHTGEKPHVCDICNKTFRNPETLKNHRYIHTGERPYKCHLCGERFQDRWARHKHVKGHGMS